MKKSYLAAFLFMAVGLVGCTNDDTINAPSIQEENGISIKDIELKVAFPDQAQSARTVVNPMGKVAWTSGDVISVFVRPSGEAVTDWQKAGYVHTFEYDGQNPSHGVFRHSASCACQKAAVVQVGQKYDWYVAHQCQGTSPEALTPNFTQVVTVGTTGEIQPNMLSLPVYGSVENSVAGSDGSLAPMVLLKHLTSLMVFHVDNHTGKDMNLKSITIEAPQTQAMFATGKLNIMTGTFEKTAPLENANMFKIQTPAEGLVLAGGASAYDFYFPCLPFSLKAGDAFKILFTESDGTVLDATKQIRVDLSFAPGKQNHSRLVLGDNMPQLEKPISFSNPYFERLLLLHGQEVASPIPDANNDGVITYGEAAKVTKLSIAFLDLKAKNIDISKLESFDDLKHFTGLQEVSIVGDDKLTGPVKKLDLRNNKELLKLECQQNQIAELLLDNPKLTEICYNGNTMTSIDLSKSPNIKNLFASGTHVTNLDLSKNTQIVWLNLAFSYDMTSLKLGNQSALKWLRIDICEKLQEFQLTSAPSLIQIAARQVGLKTIDLSMCKNLTYLDFYSSQLTAVDLAKNGNLEEINFSYCKQITELSVANNRKLKSINASQMEISTLDLTNCAELGALNVSGNRNLTELSVAKNPKLYDLNAAGSGIKSLDVSQNTMLQGLYCDGCNSLGSEFDISKNKKLDHLTLQGTPVKLIWVWKGFDPTAHPGFYKEDVAVFKEIGTDAPDYGEGNNW